MAEPQRRILPLPKRRIPSGAKPAEEVLKPTQVLSPNTLFNRLSTLNNEVNAISNALSNAESYTHDADRALLNHHDVLEESEEDEEDDDDECTGCRDWLENVKNKKKRKIPTSAVMGHTGGVSPVMTAHVSPLRASKSKTRRRRTWDVSSEARPDANLRKMNISPSFSDAPIKTELLSKEFDFVCESPVARNLPAPPPAPVELLPAEPISIATQTSPTLAAMEPILPPRHRRTKEEKAYDRQRLLAKQRREARAKLKPGEKETVWICQFCEFESVFGYAPLALINGYTERVRATKRAALERKRLLEKARSKSKKKKKATSKTAMPAPLAPVDNKIVPTHANGAKTGIDKSIGPGSTSCTCCDHRRDKEERDRRHRFRSPQPYVRSQHVSAHSSTRQNSPPSDGSF